MARVHSGLQLFQCNLPTHRLLLLGHEDDAEAAFSNLLQQLVRPDDAAGAFLDGELAGRHRAGEGLQKAPIVFIHAQQRLEPVAQRRVDATHSIEVAATSLRRLNIASLIKDDLFIDLNGHRQTPQPSIPTHSGLNAAADT